MNMNIDLGRDLENLIRRGVRDLGRGDIFRQPLIGFAAADDSAFEDVTLPDGQKMRTPRSLLPGANTVISWFLPYTKEICDRAARAENEDLCRQEIYEEAASTYERLTDWVCGYLEGSGYRGYPMPLPERVDDWDRKDAWSHRIAAQAAGIGKMAGKRLLTEKGTAGICGTIITSARVDVRRRPPADPEDLPYIG